MAHALFDMTDLRLICGQGGCPSSFITFNSFRKHVINQHPQADEPALPPIINMEDNGNEIDHEDVDNMEDVNLNVNIFSRTRQTAVFIGSVLSESNMTYATLNRVIAATANFNCDIVQNLKAKVVSTLDAIGVDQENQNYQDLLAEFDGNKALFHGLDTKYKQEQFLAEHLGIVHPKTVFLGFRYDTRTERKSGNSKQVLVPETFQYVSILSTLGMVLGDLDAVHEIENGHLSSDNRMRDYCDGQQFKTHPLFSTNLKAIQISLFFDEFEVVNPLGSKRGIHKIGAFYYTLKNFHPRLNSSLRNIHLLALCNCLDLKKYGFDPILAPFVSELRKLESEEGAKIVLPDSSVKTIHGTLAQVCGDNLGMNALLGFVESFVANKPCRICSGHKDDFQNHFVGEHFVLRDTDSHNVHVQESLDNTAAVSVSGVKRGCILNTLRYFHVTKNVAPDIMHDMLEGVIPMEVKLVLYTFIYDDKFFKLDTLNNLLSSHNYGHCDKKNKPSQILESTLKGKDHSLKQHASQMWCLVRVLPLLIGSFIPQNNPYWDLILKLRTIVDIAFADSVTESLTLYLKHLIEDHHLLFQHLYPTVRLLPKHHFLVHYPEAMREVGPLINSWCMRFEAKHNFTKKLASVINCFKDVCLTAASRHQINACCKWQQRSLGSFELEASETENYRVSNLENYPALLEQVPGLLPEDDVFMTKKMSCLSLAK